MAKRQTEDVGAGTDNITDWTKSTSNNAVTDTERSVGKDDAQSKKDRR